MKLLPGVSNQPEDRNQNCIVEHWKFYYKKGTNQDQTDKIDFQDVKIQISLKFSGVYISKVWLPVNPKNRNFS